MKYFLPLILLAGLLMSVTPENGSKAFSIELPNPNGKTISLEDLKGKVVLVDFWASWCGPCRRENPNVVEAYEKYKKAKFKNGKKFEVLSVSLDRDEKKWKDAIDKDGLTWDNHAIDKEGKVSGKYGVRSIPYAFLIDGEGNIIAQGNELRGLKLHIEMDKLLK